MRNVASAVLLTAFVSQGAAFQWPSEAIYNKWHETKLEKWLKDHGIPYPAASDRQSLYNTVQEHWDKITPPYEQWSESQLREWLVESGSNAADIAASKKDDLVNMVQSTYDDSSLVNWLLDSWTDSQLKSFLDYHNIPNPTPRNRDTLLQTARNAYGNIASIGPSTYDTLFSQWTDSDLKTWFDERGIPVPQGSTKESMLASLRRHTKSFTDQAKEKVAQLYNGASDTMFDTWSESQLKQMLDENGIPVPQGSKVNELRALARKNYKSLKNSASEYYAEGASSVSSAASSVGSDASTKAGKVGEAARKSAESAASEASKSANSLGDKGKKSAKSATSVVGKSAESASSVAAKSAESAAAKAKKSAESAASEASKTAGKAGKAAKSSLDSAASEASKTAKSVGKDAKNTAAAYAADGKKSAESVYDQATKSGASAYGKATDSAASVASDASEYALGSDNALYTLWSDSRLKSFLDARGIPVPQNGKKDELTALVRQNSHKARLAAEDFEGWSSAELQKFAKDSKIKLDKAASTSRDELVKQTQKGYSELQKKGDSAYKQAEQAYSSVKAYAFDTWSDSDLKSFLDSYGVDVPQSGTKDQLVALARKNGHYFSHGQLGPVSGSPLAQMAYDGIASMLDFVKKASGMAYGKVAEGTDKAKKEIKAEL